MNDSIASLPLPVIDDLIIDDTGGVAYSRPQTPYQVLRLLPKDATPAQQDSAIQAWFKPGKIEYSQRPDTLHLPGHGPAVDLRIVSLPQYYRENYFSGDSLYHPEVAGGRFGVAGDPVPYTIRGDNMFTSLLLLCFVIFVVSISQSRHFIVRQLKDFFYLSHHDDDITETGAELRFQLFLVLLGCLLLAITTYQYAIDFVAQTFALPNDFLLVALFFGVFVGYFLLKWGLYALVNEVFFGSGPSQRWLKTLLFIAATEGVLLFPVVLLVVYFDLPLENAVYYYGFVFIFTKILAFYKSWTIFFRQNGIFLQIFLYFCALEIVPLLGLLGGLGVLIDQLKITF